MGKHKLWIFMMLMMVLSVSIVAADVNIKAGEEYTLTSITQCYGNVDVDFRAESPIGNGEYTVLGCSEAGVNAWRCPCNTDGPTDIKMQTKANIANTYDVAVEYYIADKLPETSNDSNSSLPTQNAITNDNNKRNIAIGGIAVSSPSQDAPGRETPPVNTEGTGSAMALIGLVALVVIGGLLFVGKWLYNSRENQLDDERLNRNDALAFHNRTKSSKDEKRRMNFFDSSSNKHVVNQVPIHEQSTQIKPELVPPEQPHSVYRGPGPTRPKPKEITDKDVNDFLEGL